MNPFYEHLFDPEFKAKMERLHNMTSAVKKLTMPLKERLPTLKYKYVLLPDGRRASSGDILKRPVHKNLPLDGLDHYGFVYGTSEMGEGIIVEMGKERNVAPNSLLSFIGDHNLRTVDIIKKVKGTKITTILSRASEWQYEMYSAYSKNCQRFAFYSVFGQDYSPGIDKLNKALLPLTKFAIAVFENNKVQSDEQYNQFNDKQINMLMGIQKGLTTNINNDALLSQKLGAMHHPSK